MKDVCKEGKKTIKSGKTRRKKTRDKTVREKKRKKSELRRKNKREERTE